MTSPKKAKKLLLRRLKAGGIGLLTVVLLFFGVRLCSRGGEEILGDAGEAVDPGNMYGFSLAEFAPTRYQVKEGQAFGQVMDELGVPYPKVAQLLDLSKGIFNPRRWRAGDAFGSSVR